MVKKEIVLNDSSGNELYPWAYRDFDGNIISSTYVNKESGFVENAWVNTAGDTLHLKKYSNGSTEEITFSGGGGTAGKSAFGLSLSDDYTSLPVEKDATSASFPEDYYIEVRAFEGGSQVIINEIVYTEESLVEGKKSLLISTNNITLGSCSISEGIVKIPMTTLTAIEGKVNLSLYGTEKNLIAQGAYTAVWNVAGEPGTYINLKTGQSVIRQDADGELIFSPFTSNLYKYKGSVSNDPESLDAFWLLEIYTNKVKSATKYYHLENSEWSWITDKSKIASYDKTSSSVISKSDVDISVPSYCTSIKLYCYSQADFDTAHLLDREAIEVIQDGAKGDQGTGAYWVDIKNDYDSIPADYQGTVPSYEWETETKHTIKCFEGTSQLTFKVSKDKPTNDTGYTVQYIIEGLVYGCTIPTGEVSVWEPWVSGFTSTDITAGKIRYTLYDGTLALASGEFKAVKVKTGKEGDPILDHRIDCSYSNIIKDSDNLLNPEKLTFNFREQEGKNTPTDYETDFWYKVDSNDAIHITEKVTSITFDLRNDTPESPATISVQPTTSLTVSIYNSENVLLDSESLGVLADGVDGAGIWTITDLYQATATNVAPGYTPAENWKPTIAETTYGGTNNYLWRYETIKYSDGRETTTSITLISIWGKDGKGIKEINEYYKATKAGITPPAEEEYTEENPFAWNSDFSAALANFNSTYPRFWNKEVIVWEAGESTSDKILITLKCMWGEKGEDGAAFTGRSIYAVTSEYAEPTKPTEPVKESTETWSLVKPSCSSENKFVWSAYQSYSEDGSGIYVSGSFNCTDPQLIEAWKDDGIDTSEYAQFVKLTSNGTQQNVYYGDDGKVYINASYIKTGTMEADRILGGTLKLGVSGGLEGSLIIYDSDSTEIGSWTKDGIVISKGSININNKFIVDSSGNLTAKSGTFSGKLSGATGTFTGKLSAGSVTGSSISGGSINVNDKFIVDSDGVVTCKKITEVGSDTGSVLEKIYLKPGYAGESLGGYIQFTTGHTSLPAFYTLSRNGISKTYNGTTSSITWENVITPSAVFG